MVIHCKTKQVVKKSVDKLSKTGKPWSESKIDTLFALPTLVKFDLTAHQDAGFVTTLMLLDEYSTSQN